jgi:hypothetical protein
MSSELDEICQRGKVCYKAANNNGGSSVVGMGVPEYDYTRAEVLKACKLALK